MGLFIYTFFVQKFLTVLPLLKTHEKPRIILGIFLLSKQRNLSQSEYILFWYILTHIITLSQTYYNNMNKL